MTSPIAALRFETYVCSVERAPGGRLVAPDAVDQSLDRDRLSDFRGQQCEHGALLRSAKANVDAVAQDF